MRDKSLTYVCTMDWSSSGCQATVARRMARTRRVSKPSFGFVPFIFNLPESSSTLLLPQTEGVSLLTLFFSLLTFLPLLFSSPSCPSCYFSCLLFSQGNFQTLYAGVTFSYFIVNQQTSYSLQNQLRIDPFLLSVQRQPDIVYACVPYSSIVIQNYCLLILLYCYIDIYIH